MRREHAGWPNGDRWIDVTWVLFTLANLAAMLIIPDWETVPFHFIWVSLTILYGFRVWRTRPTIAILALVMALTGAFITIDVKRGGQPLRRAHRGAADGRHVRGDGVARAASSGCL